MNLPYITDYNLLERIIHILLTQKIKLIKIKHINRKNEAAPFHGVFLGTIFRTTLDNVLIFSPDRLQNWFHCN